MISCKKPIIFFCFFLFHLFLSQIAWSAKFNKGYTVVGDQLRHKTTQTMVQTCSNCIPAKYRMAATSQGSKMLSRALLALCEIKLGWKCGWSHVEEAQSGKDVPLRKSGRPQQVSAEK